MTRLKTPWTPGSSDLVCSLHFVDGKPTLGNPNPSINVGYEKPAKKARPKLVRHEPTAPKKARPEENSSSDSLKTVTESMKDNGDYC